MRCFVCKTLLQDRVWPRFRLHKKGITMKTASLLIVTMLGASPAASMQATEDAQPVVQHRGSPDRPALALSAPAEASQSSTLPVYPGERLPVDERVQQPAFEGIHVVPYSLWEVPLPKVVDRNAIPNRDDDAGLSDFEANFSAVFREPAHFPVLAFGSCGCTRARDAALIYEGMTLAVGKDGNYEVRMVIEAPRRPVVIHMQLQVHEYAQDPLLDGKLVAVPVGTITLAPITLESDPDVPRHQTSRTFQVRRGGYSHVLREIELAESSSRYTITRVGTARFGRIPD